jgi:hypothetical protein
MTSLASQVRVSIFNRIRSNVKDRIRYTLNAYITWNIDHQMMWMHFNLIDSVDNVTYTEIGTKLDGTSIY